MPYYRLYHIDQNRFLGVDSFHASDDVEAMRDARLRNGTATSELWEGGRKIKTLHAPRADKRLVSALAPQP